MAMTEAHADFKRKSTEARLKRNMVTLDGTLAPWWDTFSRLSDDGMKTVREKRAACH